MMQWSWKQNAACCIGALSTEDEATETFARSWWRPMSPLLWRIPIFLWVLITLSFSLASFWGPPAKYLLYMTHWGLILILLESLAGILVTIKQSCGGTPDPASELPWYVKTYWVLYNITIPVAFLITVFYWGVLKASGKIVNFAPNPVLDVMLHGVNSFTMFIELVGSAHPSRLLHVMQPLYFALAYLLFSVIYYSAGGLDPWSNHFIYPVIDWSKPQQTMVVVTLTALFLALMHILVVGVAAIRDVIASKCRQDPGEIYKDKDGFVA